MGDGDMFSPKAAAEFYSTTLFNQETAITACLTIGLFTIIPIVLRQGLPKILFSWFCGLFLFVSVKTCFSALVEDKMKPEMLIYMGMAAVILVNVRFQLNSEYEMIVSVMSILFVVWVLVMIAARTYYRGLIRVADYVLPPPDLDDLKCYEKTMYDRFVRKFVPSRLRWLPNVIIFLLLCASAVACVVYSWAMSIAVVVVLIYGSYKIYPLRRQIMKAYGIWFQYVFMNQVRIKSVAGVESGMSRY